MVMLLRGFADALLMRSQQAIAFGANEGYLPPHHYDQIFTAHGVIMIFFVAMPIVSVPLMPLVPVASSVPVHRTRSVRLAAAVPSDDVDAEVEPVPAVRIRPRVCVAVVSMISDDALDPLVGLLGRLAVVRSVSSCSRGPGCESEAVDSMMEAAHCPVRRENVGLPPSNL